MRLRSIHPKYLDSKWLVALWREWLLAKKVLEWNTKGYKNHPQLDRFKKSKKPLENINTYLSALIIEADIRSYKFDASKLEITRNNNKIKVTHSQIKYEFQHLLKKLKTRDPKKHDKIKSIKNIEIHPIFEIIEWEIESWEIIQ